MPTVTPKKRPYAVENTEPSMAHQSFKDECDINNIMAKYVSTGLLEHQRAHQGRYGDFCDAPSYHEAMNQVAAVTQMFDALPAPVREHFGNDPADFLAAAGDPERQQELVELGLVDNQSQIVPPGTVPAAEPVVPQSQEGPLKAQEPSGEGTASGKEAQADGGGKAS